jgi:hypothetical protein
MSLQEAYKNILKSRRHFDKYLMYKKLILQGYKLKAADETRAKDEPKRKLVTTGEGTSAKVAKLQLGEGTDMSDIFAKLRQSGPRDFPVRDWKSDVARLSHKCCRKVGAF